MDQNTFGADFSDIKPQVAGVLQPAQLVPNYAGIDSIGTDRQLILESFYDFRPGQAAKLMVEVFVDVAGVESVLLKPWWLRQNAQFRGPGPGGSIGPYRDVDVNAFGPLQVGGLAQTHRAWLPSCRQEACPQTYTDEPHVVMRHDHVIWEFQLNQGDIAPGYSCRYVVNTTPEGLALGFTSDFSGTPGAGNPNQGIFITEPTVRLTWMTGVMATALLPPVN